MKRRTRLAEGIYQDRYGLSATVKVGGVQKERRFPVGTALELLKSWRIQTRAELDEHRATLLSVVSGTLRHDGDKFLDRKKTKVAYKADRSHLRAWYPAFGNLLRSKITRDMVERQMVIWASANVAARTIRHRCRVLRECYRALDGATTKTPMDRVRLPRVPPSQPVAVPVQTIRRVAASMLKAGLGADYARFTIRALTGQRPAQVMRAQPGDVDFKRRIWFVRPAKGGTQIPFPLNAEAVKAWKYFAKVNAWGAFDTEHAADVARAHGWPKDVPLYALRSTMAIDLLLKGASLRDVQGLLGHRSVQTTEAHYAPILLTMLRGAINRRTIRLVPKRKSA